MSSYIGRHAELYDIFYADKPYEEEALFIHQCLKQFSSGTTRRLIELACGTGTHALALEKYGYEIIGTDYSPDLLSIARQKAAAYNSKITFLIQDMRTLNVPGEPFDAAICLFDSIGYVATNEALMCTLQNVHRHLRKEGLFVFEFWHAGAMLRKYDPIRVRRWIVPDGELVRISETTIDCANQLSHVTYSIYELRRNGTYSSLKETQTNRYFLVQEMEGWLKRCSFDPVKWFAGFTNDENVTEDIWHIVAVARKA